MSVVEAEVDAVRESARTVRLQVAPREWAGALLVALQVVVWLFPAPEPAQLVRASLGRPWILLSALAERASDGAWSLLGPLALVVPGLAAWVLFDPPRESPRPCLKRLAVGAVGIALVLEALGDGISAWLSGGVLGGIVVSALARATGSELWGATLAAVVGAVAIGWASGLWALLGRNASQLRSAGGRLIERTQSAAGAGAQASARRFADAIQWLEEQQPSPEARKRSAPEAEAPSELYTLDGTLIEDFETLRDAGVLPKPDNY